MAQLPMQLLKGDKVDARVDYRDAMPKNVSAVIRQIYKIGGYMLQQPGLTELGTLAGIDRGGIWNERFGLHLRISAQTLCEVASNGTFIDRGIITGVDTVSLPYSFNTQGIVADGKFYLYDPTNGLQLVTDVDIGVPIDGVWVDGYYMLTDGEFLYHTELIDEMSIDPLKYATSEFSPDPTIGLGVTPDNKVIAFNRYTTEYFANQGNEFFAFTRIPSRAVRYGLVATHAKAEIAGQWYMLGGPKEGSISVYALGVGDAVSIASREVTQIIAEYDEAELAETILETRIVDDYPYLILNLPDEVLLFNFKVAEVAGKEMAWSVLTSSSVNNAKWRGLHGIFEPRIGRWVYGDNQSAKIGYLNELIATQYGQIIEAEIYTPFALLECQSIDEVNIETIPGFTSTNDATVFLSFTYNGVTYGAEVLLEYGAPGAYGQRFIAYRLGYVDNSFGMKLRWASRSRMCFSRAVIEHG